MTGGAGWVRASPSPRLILMITLDVPDLRRAVQKRHWQGRPVVTAEPVGGVTELILDSLYRRADVATTYAIGTGTRLAQSLRWLVTEIEEQLHLDRGDCWPQTRIEVRRSLERFFQLAGGQPAAIFGHCLCWSDQAMIKHFAGADLTVAAEPHQEEITPSTPNVKMRFTPNRGIWLRSDHLVWLRPPNSDRERTRLVRLTQARSTRLGRRLVSPSRREALGLVVDPRVDRWALRANTFPSLQGRTFGLVGNTQRRAIGIIGTNASDKGFRAPQPRRGTEVLDAGGILDVVIVKGIRFLGPGEVDEFSFSITPRGKVAYVAATADTPFLFATERVEDNPWFLWLMGNR